MNDLTFGKITVHASVYLPVLYAVWVNILLLLKRLFYRKIRKMAEHTRTDLDDIFLDSLEKPLVFMIFASGLYVIQTIFGLGIEGDFLKTVDLVFKAVGIISIIVFADSFLRGMIKSRAEKTSVIKTSEHVLTVVARGIVIGLGVLMLLDSAGVSITPVLASLGIGSLAVALALQPTLENFFSGLQIIADKPVEPGQFVKLETGEEGYVERIGWRSTWIRQLPNNMVVIPNKVLVNSRVLNYYYPDKELAVLVQVGVHYDSDLEQVEKVTIEVAEDVLKTVQGGVPDFKPFIRYHTLADFSINFSVIMRGKEFVDGYLIKHEFIKRLRKRYAQEGIIIPYPIRTLDWNDNSSPLRVDKGTQG